MDGAAAAEIAAQAMGGKPSFGELSRWGRSLAGRLRGWLRGQHFARRFFEQLETEYVSLCPGEYQQQRAAEVAELRGQAPSWAVNDRFEHVITRGLPAVFLRQRIQLACERLRALVEPVSADGFLSAFERPTGDAAHDRPIALALLAELQRLRLAQREFSQARSRVTTALLVIGAVFFGLVVVQFCGAQSYLPPAGYAVGAGALGGYFSVLLRLGSLDWSSKYTLDSVHVDQLFWDQTRVLVLALFEATVAALILYTLFLSGVVEGAAFPRFESVSSWGDWRTLSGWLWMAPSDSTGTAKLVVWSILAGFSERLVPDMLSALGQNAQQRVQASRSKQSVGVASSDAD